MSEAGHLVLKEAVSLIRRLGGGEAEALACAALIAHSEAGHTCALPERLFGKEFFEAYGEAAVPDNGALLRALSESPVCGAPGEWKPLIYDGKRLYLERHFRDELKTAGMVLSRAAWKQGPGVNRENLAAIFASSPRGAIAESVLSSGVAFITGGPGTGKTTLLSSILLLSVLENPSLRIGLAAPTGKAASRMKEAILRSLTRTLEEHPEWKDAGAEILRLEPKTLHRLLEYSHGRYSKNERNLLDLDLLVVDEGSMVSVAQAAALARALPEECRLLVLGDPGQLASVEAGAFLADCAGAGLSRGDPWTHTLTGTYRFSEESPVGRLAAAVRDGDAQGSLEVLQKGGEGLCYVPEISRKRVETVLKDKLCAWFGKLSMSVSPEEALRNLESFRILTPLRNGEWSSAMLNTLAEEWLSRQFPVLKGGDYPFRPVMITENDYSQRLFNGDMGLLFPDASGGLKAVFPGESGIKEIPPSLLPSHETAFAMTVHKSQGSEADEVALVLTEKAEALLVRELLYTGITRCRRELTVFAGPEFWCRGVQNCLIRESGLFDRLTTP